MAYLITVGPFLVLGPVAAIGEGSLAAGELTRVGLLSGVSADMDFEIVDSGEGFATAGPLERERGYEGIVVGGEPRKQNLRHRAESLDGIP